MSPWQIRGGLPPGQSLSHNRDGKFCPAFQHIIDATGVQRVPLPPRSPNLNGDAERWVRSVKEAALSRLILCGERALSRARTAYVPHVYQQRLLQGQGYGGLLPAADLRQRHAGPIHGHERLGGLLTYDPPRSLENDAGTGCVRRRSGDTMGERYEHTSCIARRGKVMQPSDPTLQQCRTVLQRLYGTRLQGVVLYGSCARGTEATESDIDLMVLLEGPVDAAQEIRRMWEVLYPLQLESARLLSVMAVDAALYEQGVYALYRQAKADGVAL
jgi:predicted nucleotidyltransferase